MDRRADGRRGDLRGFELMIDMINYLAFVVEVEINLAFVVEVEINFAHAKIKTSIDIVRIGDSASLIDLELYYKYVLLYEKNDLHH